jgi:hypothetical protein
MILRTQYNDHKDKNNLSECLENSILGKKKLADEFELFKKKCARISSEFKNLEYGKFKNIAKLLIKFVEKDKQTEGLIEKLFHKLKSTSDTVEWRNTTYCLSLLNYYDKNIVNLLEFYAGLKDKVEDDEIIIENFKNIFLNFKKTRTSKDLIEEIKDKFFKGEKIEAKNVKEKIASAKGKNKAGRKRKGAEGLQAIKEEDIKDENEVKTERQNQAERDDNSESGSEAVSKASSVKHSMNKRVKGGNSGIQASNISLRVRTHNKRVIDDSIDQDQDEF